jgi:glutaredoxin
MQKKSWLLWLMVLVLMGLQIWTQACGEDRPGAVPGTEAAGNGEELRPEAFKVVPGDQDLVFQYFDDAGKPRVVTDLAQVPEARRGDVMVLYPRGRRQGLPASLLILADLKAPGADGSYPVRFVNRYSFKPTGATQAVSPGQVQAAGVMLFSAPGCPHCTKARRWLTSQAIPFVEKDLSKDPSAIQLAAAAAKKQGIPEDYLSSVPLLLVNGKLLVGFSAEAVRKAL